MTPITVHVAEARTRSARPLCKGKRYLPHTYRPGQDELTWVLAAAHPPARVYLGGTGFTVPVSAVAKNVKAQGGRTLKVCEACLKALATMSDRLSPAS